MNKLHVCDVKTKLKLSLFRKKKHLEKLINQKCKMIQESCQ